MSMPKTAVAMVEYSIFDGVWGLENVGMSLGACYVIYCCVRMRMM